jgi:hypothetical protein
MSAFLSRRLFIGVVAPIGLCAAVVVASAMTGGSASNTNAIDLEADNGQYLSVSDATQVGLDITADLTIEAWVKIERAPEIGENYAIVSKWGDASDRSYWFAYTNRDGADMLDLHWSSDGVTVTQAVVDATLTPSQWHHVAVTKSGAVKFCDGSQGGPGGSSAAIFDGAADFAVGAQVSGTNANFFDGLIDDVRIWRIARDGAEIVADRSRELNGVELGLVGYWRLNGSFSDATESENTLANNGSATFAADTTWLQ